MAWIDMWTGAWASLWGVNVPEPELMGDYYNTQVEIYADTAFGTLSDIIHARTEPTVLSELKGHGAGSFKVSKNDEKILKNPKLLEYRNYVKIRLNGNVIGGFIIQTKRTVIVGAGEESDEKWEISGEGPRSWSRDASVYPPKGLQNSSAETRYFNFSTERGSWYNPTDWNWAEMGWSWNNVVNGAPKGHAPANWPDAWGARWIWQTYAENHPPGYCYFRHEFTVSGTPGQVLKYALFIAADDAAEVFVDGEQKAVIEPPGWHDTTRVELELTPGDHVIGVKAYNMPLADPSAPNPRNPGEILTALFSYGDSSAPTPAVLVNHSGMADTWRVNGYPEFEPGWTTGDVLLTLLNEAKSRGVRFANNFTPTFSSGFDSAGEPWGTPVPWSFEVGSTYEDVFSAAEELGCDIFVDPDTLELNVWNKRGTDRSLNGLLKGPLVEARRNYNVNPKMYPSISSWSTTGGLATITATTTGARIDTTAVTTSAPLIFNTANVGPTSAGDRWSSSMEIEVPTGYPAITVSLRTYSYGQNAIISDSGNITIQPGTIVRIDSNSTQDVTSATTGVRSIIYAAGSIPSGARFFARKAVLEKAPAAGKYMDGDTVYAEGGELASYRWLTTPDNSVSVQEVPSSFGDVIVFSPGHNLVAADETGQAQIANTLMLRTPEGWTEEVAEDTTSVTKFGRVETQMSTNLTSKGAENLVQELFRQKALPEVSATFDIVPVAGMIPFLNFDVGDWVSAPGEVPDYKESRRVMSISFAEDSKTGLPLYAVEFDTIFKDRQTELEKWLSRVSNSSAIGGGFTNSSNLPPTVVTKPPGTPQGVIPDAPTGLVVSSLGKYQPDGVSSSDYGLTWNAVVTGTGFGSVEVSQYEVWGRLQTETEGTHLTTVFDTMAYLPGFRPGDTWVFKVRAISPSGGPGNFSNEVALQAEEPLVALDAPSKPTLLTAVGSVTVQWDGKLGGNPAPPFVRYVRVERSPAGANTWQTVGVLTSFSMSDMTATTGLTYDYRLIAVDTYGNSSAPSVKETIQVKGVNSGDITGGLASNNLVANGSFEDGFDPFWKILTSVSGATATVLSSGSFSGARYLRLVRNSEPVGSEIELAVGQESSYFIPISSVGEFGYFVSAKAASSVAASPGNFSLRAYWFLSDKTTPASASYSTVVDKVDLTSSAAYFTGRVYPPADARYMRVVVVNAKPATTIFVDDIVAREAITPNMLGQDVILAEHMSAGSVTTNALQAGSVTTEILDAGAVRAENIYAGAIQVSHLSPSVGSSIDISANSSVNILINKTNQLEGDLGETTNAVNQLTTYYSFGPDGAIIGQTDSAFKLHLKNDRIEILENGIVVSYWDSGRMVVRSFVGEEVVLGNHKLEKYGTGTVVRAI